MLMTLHVFLFFIIPINLVFSTPSRFVQDNELVGINPHSDINQLTLEHFTHEKGLPSSGGLLIFQSRSGYTWISTYNGLVRFDGVEFDIFDKSKLPVISTNAFTDMDEDDQGNFLIGSYGGLLVWNNEKLKLYTEDDGLPNTVVDFIEKDERGFFWIGTIKGLCIYENGNIHQKYVPENLKTKRVSSAYFNGEVKWFATHEAGLFKVVNDKVEEHYLTSKGLSSNTIFNVVCDKLSNVWVATSNGLDKINEDGLVESYTKQNGYSTLGKVTALCVDRHNVLWIGTSEGVMKMYDGNFSDFRKLPNVSRYEPTSIYEDSEGNVWVSTYRDGFFILRDNIFEVFDQRHGLGGKVVYAVAEAKNKESYIVATSNGLFKGGGNEFKPYLRSQLPSKAIRDILIDYDGNEWYCTTQGLLKVTPEGVAKVFGLQTGFASDYIRNICQTQSGDIWIGTRNGLHIIKKNGVQIIQEESGLINNYVLSIMEDSKGKIWVGTKGGISLFEGDRIENFTYKNGLAGDVSFKIYEDKDGVIWAGANGGLARYKDGVFRRINSSNGLYEDSAFQILEDDQGYFWVTCNTGIYKVLKAELNAFCESKIVSVKCVGYNKYDGLKTGATANSRSLIDHNGGMWFCTQSGLFKLNENRGNPNQPPRILLKSLKIDENLSYLNQGELVLDPQVRRLEFSFAGINYKSPKKLSYAFKLENFDDDWNYTLKREAVYTNIPAGDYVFKVKAIDHEGNESLVPLEVILTKQPHFYETVYFYALVFLGMLMLSGLFYYWRLMVHKKYAIELEGVVEARTHELMIKGEELSAQAESMKLLSDEIKRQNDNIRSSIKYAKRIQTAMLPDLDLIRRDFPDFFVFFKPRDDVSGDFFWYSKVGGKAVIAAVDCTGHGVPGAFMSMIGETLLNQIVNLEKTTSPKLILEKLNLYIFQTLNQKKSYNRDGMDLSVVTVDLDCNEIRYSGARMPIIMFEQDESGVYHLKHVKANRNTVGGYQNLFENSSYDEHVFEVTQETVVYMFSDGYQDQFGGEKNKKFMLKRIKDMLIDIQNISMDDQYYEVENNLKQWMRKEQQVDDVLFMGFKVKARNLEEVKKPSQKGFEYNMSKN
ncbi:two-component regulator propeller domain-containing protein [Aureibacter tunicatorum]|uniref:Ligand-binding sensor domain-containing protein/serine phosphatase RsbU (Regulator of sigma subunit) n=1 Tax=Aureibacter tunicatorum TaxID=866807 RepID=A0AAE3XSP6_9BACT|nr:two-component regulator propeller domain-containing protein [Aureibacter tunicatorum]MDR6242058.1 ligand-binding sensor domain-containing protein/serine phosphatase RsbU (regulator of sigma subunit) [Aureibacter tunicatorum]